MMDEPGTIELFPSYLAVIKNSVGTNMFRTLYFDMGDGVVDVLNNGDLSCAVFVSNIAKVFNLIKEGHTTVDGTVRDLETSGWIDISEPRTGCIFVWESHPGDDGKNHKHIGFCVGPQSAISNSYLNRCPIEHEYGYRGLKIERTLWHPALEQ